MTLSTYLDSYDPLPALGFVAGDYSFMASETLEALNITLESESTDKILHLVGKVQYWLRVVAITSGDHDFSADGASYSRSQVNKMAHENLAVLVPQASAYLVGELTVDFGNIVNPYQYTEARDSAGNY